MSRVRGSLEIARPVVSLIGRRQERTICTSLKLSLEGPNDGREQDGSQPP